MEALSVVASVGIVCGSGLVAFRWWLLSRKSEPAGDLPARVAALESWKTRAELGKLR